MKKLLALLLTALLLLSLASAHAEVSDDYYMRLFLNGKLMEPEKAFNVAPGDRITITADPAQKVKFISVYLSDPDNDFNTGEASIFPSDTASVGMPRMEYQSQVLFHAQATWEGENDEDYSLSLIYPVNYIGGNQYIDVDVSLSFEEEELDLEKGYYFKPGDEIKITASSLNELSVECSSDVELMRSLGFSPNDQGMAFIAYSWDNEDIIQSELPNQVIVIVPEDFELDTEHSLTFCAVAASDNWNREDGSHIEAETDWLSLHIVMTE
ncbi:MAG: hypothetical protein IJ217_03765 [Clostridia bacterium]|nr:hypothetical protein [Clostridia bacterium]